MMAYHPIRGSNLRAVSPRFPFCDPILAVSDYFMQEIATITYRSGPEWDIRFGRQLRTVSPAIEQRIPALCPDFLIETYLDHQASPYEHLSP
jgi:hypothetical protein